MSNPQENKGGLFRWFVPLSGVVGLIATVLPLYLYPMATFDPIQGGSFYQSADYFRLYVPYAVFFTVMAGGILLARPKKIFAFLLLTGFLISHLHFKWIFKEAIDFKPAFMAVFVFLPALVFSFGALAAPSSSGKAKASS